MSSSNRMVLPFSTVKAADLKGNMFGFGDPGAREMRDFGALLIISTAILMGDGFLARLVAVRNRE